MGALPLQPARSIALTINRKKTGCLINIADIIPYYNLVMITMDISGGKNLKLQHLVSDLNGTLALDGSLLPGVVEAVTALRGDLHIILLTADTFGKGRELAASLGVELHILHPGSEREQKAAFVRQLGSDSVVTIGQGANDELMLKESALGICVLSQEGTALPTLLAADVLVSDGAAAMQLLLHPVRISATLRK